MVYLVWVVGRLGGLNLPDDSILGRVCVEGAVLVTEWSHLVWGVGWVQWEALNREVVMVVLKSYIIGCASFGQQ